MVVTLGRGRDGEKWTDAIAVYKVEISGFGAPMYNG